MSASRPLASLVVGLFGALVLGACAASAPGGDHDLVAPRASVDASAGGSGSDAGGSSAAPVAAPTPTRAARATTLDPATASRTAHLDGSAIRFLDTGGDAREALVLVHGWGGATAAWAHQFPAWADMGRVVVVDLIGHGASDAPVVDYSFERMADSVLAAMDAAGVERAVLVGHSNGVPVVMDLAHRRPGRVLAVVALDGTLRPVFTREAFDAMFGVFRGPAWREALAGMIEAMPAPGLSDEDRAAIRDMALATPQHVLVSAAEASLADGAFHEPDLDVPLLLLLAAQPTWTDEYEAWVRERVPHVEYVVWTDIGHYIQFERPDAFHDLVRGFLARHELLDAR